MGQRPIHRSENSHAVSTRKSEKLFTQNFIGKIYELKSKREICAQILFSEKMK